MHSHWPLIRFAWFVALIHGYLSVHAFFRSRSALLICTESKEQQDRRKLPTRPLQWSGVSSLVLQVLILFVIVSEFALGHWRFEDMGYNPECWVWLAMVAGISVYAVCVFVYAAIIRMLGRVDEFEDASFLVNRSMLPRSRRGKCLMFVSTCILNPINEELIYRGVLVFALGQLVEDFRIVIPLVLLVNLVVHLYQGVGLLLFHAMFFLISVALLFSPFGLVGAVSFHFAGDLFPLIMFRTELRRWVERRRAARRPAPHRI